MTRNANKTKEFSEKNSKCGSAGIGRQARLRCVCRRRGGSSPLPRTKLSRDARQGVPGELFAWDGRGRNAMHLPCKGKCDALPENRLTAER